MTTPTPEEHARICRTIAEHCGWYDIAFTAPERGSMTPRMTGRVKERMDRRLLPSYTTSLDAMAEAEATLSEEERTMFVTELQLITLHGPLFAEYFATALQRALAFVAVKERRREG